MRQHSFLRHARCGAALLLTGLVTCAQAVELGEALVRSHRGQPLSADIELSGIANDAANVQVALADIDVYRGANISMHPALASLTITVVRRDGKRFAHLISQKPVATEFVNIFFELSENGRRAVRQATLWITQDPNPQPVPATSTVLAVPAPLPLPPPLPLQVTLPVAAPLPARVPAVARLPAAPFAAPLQRAMSAGKVAACAQPFTAEQIETCSALDAKNALLSAQIVELEEKVRRLMAVMGTATPPPAAVAPAPVAPARVVPAPAPLAPVVAPANPTPWLIIGITVTLASALIGVLLFLLHRKRKAALTAAGGPARAGLIASVKQRLMPGKKEAEKTT